jgi:hypothetical protein
MKDDQSTETVTGTHPSEPGILRDDHHVGFNQALKRALADLPDSWKGKTCRLTYRCHISENPGEIDQYHADLTLV